MSKAHIGSNFDTLLADDDLLLDAQLTGIKCVIAFQILQLMDETCPPHTHNIKYALAT
jgi:hypothetical protein